MGGPFVAPLPKKENFRCARASTNAISPEGMQMVQPDILRPGRRAQYFKERGRRRARAANNYFAIRMMTREFEIDDQVHVILDCSNLGHAIRCCLIVVNTQPEKCGIVLLPFSGRLKRRSILERHP